MTRAELKELTAFAADSAIGAGAILRRGFNRAHHIRYKGRIDPVTEFDLKAEAYITSRITRRYPHHDILAEEGTATGQASKYRWIVDPLDGTVNFAHRFPIYCVSIALEYAGEIVVGVVYDPERAELFRTCRGGGSYLNSKSIAVSKESNLERSLVATGFAYDVGSAKKNNLGLFARMVKQVQGVRRPGSAAIDLCWLACGRLDGFWELKLHPWDTAAAVLIIKNSGGRISRIDGRPYSVYDPDLLASNGKIHAGMKQVLNNKRTR